MREAIDKIAKVLNLEPEILFSVLTNKKNYRIWYKKKTNGKMRCFEAPLKDLKTVQSAILSKLIGEFPKCVQGGVYKRSIRTNALEHKQGEYLLRMDIKDAYPSVTRKQIYILFKRWGASIKEARIYTKLVTFRGHLPQGAPTSLIFFNLLLSNLGIDQVLSKIKGVRYTRYVDDFIFTSKKPIPEKLEKEISVFLEENGFSINQKKTRRYSIKNRPLRVTGVNIIDGKPKIPPKMIKRFRGMIGRAVRDNSVSKNQVFGIIAFIIGIEKKIPNQLLKPLLNYLEVNNIKDCPFVY